MAIKIEVLDRVPTYPGRVVLTPVSGQDNTYDLVRADSPITEGTPLNKALLDQKAYTLTGDVTVYVNGSTGNDLTGDGTSALPFATIQKAVDALPKWLDGHTATIDIAEGTYEGRVVLEGFQGGLLVLGVVGRAVTVRGIQVLGCSTVRINVAEIVRAENVVGTLLAIRNGSDVLIGGRFVVDGMAAAISGIVVESNSAVAVTDNALLIVRNCAYNAVYATTGARISLAGIAGANNGVGLRSDSGSVISFSSKSIEATTENITTNGGRIYSGAQASIPSY